MFRPFKLTYSVIFLLFFSFVSCKNNHNFKQNDLVTDASQMNVQVKANIENIIAAAGSNERLQDSTSLQYYNVLKFLYDQNQSQGFWSSQQKWTKNTVTLLNFIDTAAMNGLYKEDYHYEKIKQLKNLLETDSIKKMDAVLWANADVLFSDAFTGLLKDLKQGRLVVDSSSYKNDTAKYRTFFNANFDKFKSGQNLADILAAVQPQYKEYKILKTALKIFTAGMDSVIYTYITYPYKDSLRFITSFKKRMLEEGIDVAMNADSNQIKTVVKKYQVDNGLVADGKIGNSVVKKLNLTDRQKFNIIAITLDKYKMLPEIMPEKYIWVNLPSFYLKVLSADTVVFSSKIICGKPITPTPNITSAINNMVLFPTWTVPTSIIKKDMLPALKKNSAYLARKGLYLLNGKGEHVDASSINWAKYTKEIPFLIQQGSGDDNALGVIKFNFENPYSVYLHDTNQRYLFKNSVRSLSHGCVRVQDWQKLANFIVRNDSLKWKKTELMPYNTDSIISWIAQKQKHSISVKNKIPLFIRYFSCEAVNGGIKFYDDIYAEDKALKQQFFAAK